MYMDGDVVEAVPAHFHAVGEVRVVSAKVLSEQKNSLLKKAGSCVVFRSILRIYDYRVGILDFLDAQRCQQGAELFKVSGLP